MIRHRVSRLDLVGPRRIAALACACTMMLTIAVPAVAQTPGWTTWWNDNTYYKPNYPLAFVVVPRVEVPYDPQHPENGVHGVYNIGTDVLTANQPSAGSALYLYLPSDGTVVKLFPRAAHFPPPPGNQLIDFDPAFGAVVEPSLSEDGTKIYFSYYQDARQINYTTCNPNAGDCLLWTGADIYSIDISSWLTNTQTNPDNPAFVKRLTTRTYEGGTGSGSRKQFLDDRDKDAMNIPSAHAASSSNQYGTSFLHPTEMRTKNGLSLVFVSDERRLEHSNFHMGRTNHNFNLFIADLRPDGTLGTAVNQFQYYTTTSALSPTPLREGIAFSYQGTTEDGRNWQIQSIDSLGRWNTLLGYGANPELFHEATFCVGSADGGPIKDYLVATKYYNANNQGFGALWRQDLDPALIGKNDYNVSENGYRVPYQLGSTPISVGATSQDGVSLAHSGVYYGKLTTPRCGGVNELYFTHTQTSANGRDFDSGNNKNIYKGYIGFRNSLSSWTVDNIGPGGHLRVIRSRNDIANLVWPLPIVPWSVRSNGDVQQHFSNGSIVTNHAFIKPGQPYAQIGSGSISNTDRRPFECRLNVPFNQWGSGTGTGLGNENDRVVHNQAGWNVLPAGGAPWCNVPDPGTILGIEINVTSNRKDLASDIQQFESKRVLGVYDARAQGPSDMSFRTLIPANTPIELQLLERTYGMKLTDVPSWHSLKPREMRVTCGGCHQHEAGATPTTWDGTYASQHAPVDLVRSTPKLKYDAHCQPVMVPGSGVASETVPEWRADVWPGMKANCSGCHQPGSAGATSASLAALSWSGTNDDADAASVYGQIATGMFASIARGALGSQLFWAARGKRTDNRDNNAAPSYAAHYDCDATTDQNCTTEAYRYGFHYGSAHNRFDQICSSASGDQGLADWIFTLGKWIDNSVPRDVPGWSSKADRFHPTADVAITDATCNGSQMWAGWWDDSNALKSVQVSLISGGATSVLFLKQAAGSAWFPNSSDTDPPFSVPGPLADSDVVMVEVIDSSDNRQVYKKRVDQLRSECALPVMVDPELHP